MMRSLWLILGAVVIINASMSSAINIRHKHGCPECLLTSSTISNLESKMNYYKQKYLQALGDLMNFVSMHQPHLHGGHIHPIHLHPIGSPIVNSQVTDMHPDGSVTVSQSTNHRPTGISGIGHPNIHSHESTASFRPHPSRRPHRPNRPHRPPGLNLFPGKRPIVNSQVIDVNPNGTVSVSQSSNHHRVTDRPIINSNEQLNDSVKPNQSLPQDSEENPIVNSQVTNVLPNGDQPVVNSQVTEF